MAISEHFDPERATLMEQFHHARQSGEPGAAVIYLEKALQTSEYRAEALIWKGIIALQQHQPQNAFIYLSSASHALPSRADIRALAARAIMAQEKPQLASKLLTAAWQQMPFDPALRQALWQARSQTETPARLLRQIRTHLPEINDGKELRLVLSLLARQADGPARIGILQHDRERDELHGWALDLRQPQRAVRLQIGIDEKRVEITADRPHDLLGAAGISTTLGGFRYKVPASAQVLHACFDDDSTLLGSPVSRLPAFTPPDTAYGKLARREPVDVLVPVYDGYDETLECLHSVLQHKQANRTAHRLVVLDDATPNPQLKAALQALAASGDILHIEQPSNLGFIRNTNRGMAYDTRRDVVWLNADTRVHGNWLDRLRKAAYSADDIASVTPFTNNGELMSFPQSRVSHPMPDAAQQAQLDELARETDSEPVEIETGCGFCLYIKRSALDAVGFLDEVHLLRGYGEETDWCLRARSKGWRHIGAPNVFVAHQGGISFGEEKVLRVAHNNAILRRRYPDAEARYQAFCLRDPLAPARQALQRARLRQLRPWLQNANQTQWPNIGPRQLHLQAAGTVDAPLTLTWSHTDGHCQARLAARLPDLEFSLEYRLPENARLLTDELAGLELDELIYHGLENCPAELVDLARHLARPYRVVCSDDALLASASNPSIKAFAAGASAIEVPAEALRARFVDALGVDVTCPRPRQCTKANSQAPRTLLIADDLRDPQIATQWVEAGRHISRNRLDYLLLVQHDGPWTQSLIATGAVQMLHEVPGLTAGDSIALTGCAAALSLNAEPGASWPAPAIAATFNLPLYAPPSDFAREIGAAPIHILSVLPGQHRDH